MTADPLVDWLRPLIEARKATAVAAAGSGDGVWSVDHDPCYDEPNVCRDGENCEHEGVIGDGIKIYPEGGHDSWQADHIALNDPRQIIADCEKDLALLNQHPPGSWVGDDEDRWQRCAGEDWVAYPCRMVRLIAWSYRHRDPDGYTEVAGDWSP